MAANLQPLAPTFQVSAYMMSNPTPPAVWVVPGETRYDLVGSRGGDTVELKIVGLMSTTIDKVAQDTLDELLATTGARSVKALVEADSSLGGVVDDLRVTEATGYFTTQTAAGPCLAVEWTVEIIT